MNLPINLQQRRNAHNLMRALTQEFYRNGMINQPEHDITSGQHILVQALCNYVESNPDCEETETIKQWLIEQNLSYDWDEVLCIYTLIEIPAPDEDDEPSDMEIALFSGQDMAQSGHPYKDNPYDINKSTALWYAWASTWHAYQELKVVGEIRFDYPKSNDNA